MLLLTESQIDRIVGHRRVALLGGLALMSIPFALPRGWGSGLFSGFMLFSLGIYGVCFQKWRIDRGLWMLAVLLTITLGPCWAYFEYLHWQGVFAPPAANNAGRLVTWNQIRLSADAAIALLLFARTVKLAVTVCTENWRRTRLN